ncbi:MAG: hypothetical protein HOJ35_01610 [Bdellovibrionales bacterium]|jgi:hypothetical protein|nr:hypothetical protein [Bdellovibrionales bacterium]
MRYILILMFCFISSNAFALKECKIAFNSTATSPNFGNFTAIVYKKGKDFKTIHTHKKCSRLGKKNSTKNKMRKIVYNNLESVLRSSGATRRYPHQKCFDEATISNDYIVIKYNIVTQFLKSSNNKRGSKKLYSCKAKVKCNAKWEKGKKNPVIINSKVAVNTVKC